MSVPLRRALAWAVLPFGLLLLVGLFAWRLHRTGQPQSQRSVQQDPQAEKVASTSKISGSASTPLQIYIPKELNPHAKREESEIERQKRRVIEDDYERFKSGGAESDERRTQKGNFDRARGRPDAEGVLVAQANWMLSRKDYLGLLVFLDLLDQEYASREFSPEMRAFVTKLLSQPDDPNVALLAGKTLVRHPSNVGDILEAIDRAAKRDPILGLSLFTEVTNSPEHSYTAEVIKSGGEMVRQQAMNLLSGEQNSPKEKYLAAEALLGLASRSENLDRLVLQALESCTSGVGRGCLLAELEFKGLLKSPVLLAEVQRRVETDSSAEARGTALVIICDQVAAHAELATFVINALKRLENPQQREVLIGFMGSSAHLPILRYLSNQDPDEGVRVAAQKAWEAQKASESDK